MSFSHEQKQQIISSVYKSVCCRRALLSGVLFAKGKVFGNSVTVRLEKREYAEFISRLVQENYGKIPTLFHPKSGGRVIEISFDSKSAVNYISSLKNNELKPQLKCSGCQSSFLRGVFLAAGRTGNPQKGYFVEYSLDERTAAFADYLKALGISGRVYSRNGAEVLIIKESAMLEDLFGYTGLNGAFFALIDAKFGREERRQIMRVINCETNNLQKTVNAATEQNLLITELEEANLLSSLPEELEATARLRLAYPRYSLSQLAQIAVPAISKPGLSHRLKKICELAKQLLHKND